MAAAVAAAAARTRIARAAGAAAPSTNATSSRLLAAVGAAAQEAAGIVPARVRSFITVSDDGKTVRDHLPTARGLYDPNLERDSCGVG